MTSKTFGQLARHLRRDASQTLADIADEIGVTVQYVSQVERGVNYPPGDPEMLRKWAEKLIADDAEITAFLDCAAAERPTLEDSRDLFLLRTNWADVCDMVASRTMTLEAVLTVLRKTDTL